MGISGGVESWIGGFVGGYYGFGESKGVSGAVNNQIVLYLFARGVEGILRSGARRGVLPPYFDVRSETGFRLFAGFSLALILYLTEYEPSNLRPGFAETMDFIYYDSNKGPLSPQLQYSPFVYIIYLSLLALTLSSLLPSSHSSLLPSPSPGNTQSTPNKQTPSSPSSSLLSSLQSFLQMLTLDSILNRFIA